MAVYTGHQNVHGYICGHFVILHVWERDKEVDNILYYAPACFAVNPKCIEAISELNSADYATHRTKIYFNSRDDQTVIEKFEDVLMLIEAAENNTPETTKKHF